MMPDLLRLTVVSSTVLDADLGSPAGAKCHVYVLQLCRSHGP